MTLPANLVTNKTARLPGDLALPPTVKPKRSKYNAVKVEADGYVFDSKMEYARYLELLQLEKAGVIVGLVVHPEYMLKQAVQAGTKVIRPIVYEGDFAYIEGGQVVCEDVKGHKTPAFLLKAKMFRAEYPHIDLRIIRKARG